MKTRTLSRRRLLGWGAAGVAAGAIGGSARFVPHLVPAAHGQTAAAPAIDEIVATTCSLCVNKCGLYAMVREGVIRTLEPNPTYPKSHGMLCAKGNSAISMLYDPNRLKSPLIRTGPRGSGEFRTASWEEALDHVAERLGAVRDELGPEGVLFSSTEGFQEEFFLWFTKVWGSPNVARHPTLCLASMVNGMFNTFGATPDFDLTRSRYVIMAGANRFESLVNPDSVDLMRGLGNGPKIVVVDPRFTITASKADEWLPIRPGTDLALVLAMIHVIIQEGRWDRDFVERYTVGFEELAEHVKPYTPEFAAGQCDLDAEVIRRIAREFADAAPRVVFYPGRRSSWNTNDTQFRRGIGIINAIVGAWDRPGALVPKAKIPLGEPDIFPPDDIEVGRLDGLEEAFPLANRRDGAYLNIRRAVLEADTPPVKAWMVYKQNPLHSVPESRKTLEMMEKLDFICTIDTQVSDTAWMSDVVLPESFYLERTDPLHSLSGAVPVVAMRQQVVPPRHDTRSCFWIMKQLAERLDRAEYFDFTMEEWIEAQAEDLPVSLEELRRKGYYADRDEPVFGKTLEEGYRFRTKTGKIELVSARYAENGYDPLPVYRPPSTVPSGRYRLLTGRTAIYTHSSLQSSRLLAEVDPDGPNLWIHPDVAARHGLEDGQETGIRSDFGEATVPVTVTDRIRADCVFLPHGFGHQSGLLPAWAQRGARSSDLIGSAEDRVTGNAAMHETSVELYPVASRPHAAVRTAAAHAPHGAQALPTGLRHEGGAS
ncbi:MAG: molybdopterin-dependent oxidoreductase [Gemmatimonadetes bacterium]|nr:molybdopterin-dependent oxidoreductase [Gemmatimonadota bacterium]